MKTASRYILTCPICGWRTILDALNHPTVKCQPIGGLLPTIILQAAQESHIASFPAQVLLALKATECHTRTSDKRQTLPIATPQNYRAVYVRHWPKLANRRSPMRSN